ncbi:class I SAM-dependent methyltransferase [Hoyosella sp. G463]|uniref:Class I SAM-dependent methyltransferase n=1 Tax=Lolliginicoccus lacisalsi TaxID=2742202 RepID=A0A927PLA8_9ACTN|nr:class I SAM-dependent methyltransferase [Lolliginicoccus lacisalsi]MBD8506915.1 class I SAM-dependent methyltransferase [Lolliginicoccus lacisalsi]
MTDRARSFGQAAASYDQVRPRYPRELLARMLPTEPGVVVDCGAGTGILTAALTALGHDVIAVDPDPRMLDQLRATLPGITALEGRAESIPLGDASARAVVLGQAWHWVDVEAASREIDRVLEPGGSLLLLWNIRDEAVPWVRELTGVMQRSPAEDLLRGEGPRVAAPFAQEAVATQAWERSIAPDELRELVRSRSNYLVAGLSERARVDARVEELLASHPDLRGRARIELPYRTYAFRYRRA